MKHVDVAAIDAVLVPETELATTTPEQKIAAWKEEVKDLRIAGEDDKAGYEIVRKHVAFARTSRTSIDKKREELKRPHLEAGKMIDARAKELIALMEPEEKRLKAMLDEIDNIKEERRLQAERERLQKIENRKQALFDAGATFNGQYIAGTVSVTQVGLETSSDEDFDAILSSVQRESDRLKAEKEEEDRLKAEAEAKLKADQEEMERQQEILRQKQADIEAAQEAARRALREGRAVQLQSLGMILDASRYEWKVRAIPVMDDSDIDELDGAQWDAKMESVKAKIADIEAEYQQQQIEAERLRKLKEEQEEKARKTADRATALMAIGFNPQSTGNLTSPIGPVEVKFLEDASDANWSAFYEDVKAQMEEHNRSEQLRAMEDKERFEQWKAAVRLAMLDRSFSVGQFDADRDSICQKIEELLK